MTKKVHYQKVTEPTLFITKGKQRVKQYDDVVYLNDGDEFELELFNPTKEKILAKIKLNDKELSSGIILRPGERVFLERYLDEARKFIFDTYKVDGDDPNTKEAIKANGKVEVDFHKEQEDFKIWINRNYIQYDPPKPNPEPPYVPGTTPGTPWPPTTPIWYYSNTGDVKFNTNNNNTTFNTNDNNITYTCFSNNMNMSVPVHNEVETGRVEKGSHSDQSFVYDDTEFSAWPTWTSSWKILPKSRKAYRKEELAIYCTGCGAKRKKSSFKFCPHCGTKF